MKKSFLVGIVAGTIAYVIGSFVTFSKIQDTYAQSTICPKDTRFIMWVEECQCGGELECEYSIVSDLGFKNCNDCRAGYEFTGSEGVIK